MQLPTLIALSNPKLTRSVEAMDVTKGEIKSRIVTADFAKASMSYSGKAGR